MYPVNIGINIIYIYIHNSISSFYGVVTQYSGDQNGVQKKKNYRIKIARIKIARIKITRIEIARIKLTRIKKTT